MNIEECTGTRSFHSVWRDAVPGRALPTYGEHEFCRWCSENVVFVETDDLRARVIPIYGTWITELRIIEWP